MISTKSDIKYISFLFLDRHAVGKSLPLVDKVQNWFLLLSKTQNGYLMTKFTRKIKLCDNTGDDLDIIPGTPIVIFAWGEQVVPNEILYHEANRGSKSIPLISSLNQYVNLQTNQLEMAEFRVDVSSVHYYYILNIINFILEKNFRDQCPMAKIQTIFVSYFSCHLTGQIKNDIF